MNTRRLYIFIPLLIALILGLNGQSNAAPTGDNDILWDHLYHGTSSSDPSAETVPGQSNNYLNVNGTSATIYALTAPGDAESMRVRYWDSVQSSEGFANMSMIGTAMWDSATYDVWQGTVSGPASGTLVYYRIDVTDGSHTAYIKKDQGLYTNPLGQHVHNNPDAGHDYSYTVGAAGPSNSVSLPSVSADFGTSGSFNVTLANDDAISGGSIFFTYDATTGLEITNHTVTGSGTKTVEIAVGTIAADAGATYAVNYTISGSSTGSSALTLTNATTLTGASSVTLNDGSFTITDPNGPPPPSGSGNRTAFVHLFEWKWTDIAQECEDWLGPKGFAAIQVSPPAEHRLIDSSESGGTNFPWWQRYQPVSYQIESRSGTRAQFADMVSRCNAVGVEIYVDAVINHMAGLNPSQCDTGSAGTTVCSNYLSGNNSVATYPHTDGQYNPEHFNIHPNSANPCNSNISNYDDAYQSYYCELLGLDDFDLTQTYVRDEVAAYLNDLVGLGVGGFRIDAAKHMNPGDLQAIAGLVNGWSAGDTYIFGEVIQSGLTNGSDYTFLPGVTEFTYSNQLGGIFRNGGLSNLQNFGNGWLNSANAVVFTDNHDNQRGHGGGGSPISHKDGTRYTLANVFMLAHPYGYPKVMSSYSFSSNDQGPPSDNNGNTHSIWNGNAPTGCGSGWECEHRQLAIANMVGFRNAADGEALTDWWTDGNNKIAFGRSDKAFVVINRDAGALNRTFQTSMVAGEYCDVIHGDLVNGSCTGPVITVQANGDATIDVGSMDAVAIHVDARVGSDGSNPTIDITSPANGSTQSGSFSVNATANYADGSITQVEFFVDGVSEGIDTTAPYAVLLDSADYTSGNHTIRATATTSDNKTATDLISILVPTPPTVELTHPANGAVVDGTVIISATAAHASGIERVDFYVDGVLVGSDSTADTPPGSRNAARVPSAITIDGSAADWNSSMLVATSPANDSAQTAADCNSGQYCIDGHNWSAHERQVDFTALYATWDSTDIYFGIQGADVIDVLDGANANSGDPTYTWDGGLMFLAIDSRAGGYSTGGDMWDKPQEFVGANNPDYQIYFSHSFWQGGPFVREHTGSAWAATTAPNLDIGESHASVGLAGKSGASYAGGPIVGYHTWDGVDNYDFVANGHDTGRDGWYELKVPLSLLGNPDLDNGCVGVFVANSHSALDSIPKDPATLDTPGVSDSNSPLEWSDTDQHSVPFLKVGNGSDCDQGPGSGGTGEYSIELDTSVYAPGTYEIEARAISNAGAEGSDTGTFVIEGNTPTELQISIDDYTVTAGGDVVVTVSAENIPAPGVGALNLDVSYDPTILSASSCTHDPNGSFDSGICNESYAANTVRMNFVDTDGVSGNATLATITFTAVGASGDVSPLGITVNTSADSTGADIIFTTDNGQVTLTDSTTVLGDVNCDGDVSDTVDGLFILQYAIGLKSGAAGCPIPNGGINTTACDVNGDGKCNTTDALLVLQCDAGMNNTFCPAPSPANSSPAAGTVSIDVGDHVVSGENIVTVPVPVTLAGGASVGSIEMTLTYDHTRFAPTGCQTTNDLDFTGCNTATGTLGEIMMNGVSLNGRTANFVLAEVSFRRLSGAFGQSPLDATITALSDENAADMSGSATVNDGQLCVDVCGVPTAVTFRSTNVTQPNAILPLIVLLLTTMTMTRWLHRKTA